MSGKLYHLSEPRFSHLTGLWPEREREMRRPPVGVQKMGASFFGFSARRAMGLAGWGTSGQLCPWGPRRRPQLAPASALPSGWREGAGDGGARCSRPQDPREQPGLGQGALWPPPLLPGPWFPHLIEEGSLRLMISEDFVLCCRLFHESLRCPTLLSGPLT